MPAFEEGIQCELKGYKLGGALPEQLRAPRMVRAAVIQLSLALPTTEPIRDQKDAILNKVAKYIDHAAACGVNIICMNELYSNNLNFTSILIFLQIWNVSLLFFV